MDVPVALRKPRCEEVDFRPNIAARGRRCKRCQGLFCYFPRYRDSDHCEWCEEELQRGGRMVIGAGLEEAGGFLQSARPTVFVTDPGKYRRTLNRRRGKACACGKPICDGSRRCASCAARGRAKKN